MKLKKSEIDRLTCPPERRDALFFDDELTGFCLRVTPRAKLFLFQYRRGSAVRRLTIGRYGDITAAQARTIAEKLRGEVAAGGDPVADRRSILATESAGRAERRQQAAVEAYTLRTLIDDWVRLGLASRSASHRREAPGSLKRHLGDRLLDAPASALTAAEMQAIVDRLAPTRPMSARRLRDYGRAMMNWGMQRRKLTANPFAALVIEARQTDRDRVLSDSELGAAWRAACLMPYPFGPLTRLLMLTLQRRTEVAGLRWSELSVDNSLWTIPSRRSKNRKGHLVHLAAPAQAVLSEISRIEGCDLVFTSTGKSPVSGFSRAMENLRDLIAGEKTDPNPNGRKANRSKIAGQPWHMHDFRRTGVTVMARLGIAEQVADRILNHVEGKSSRSVAEVYQRYQFIEERKFAAQQWAEHVLKCAKAVAEQKSSGQQK